MAPKILVIGAGPGGYVAAIRAAQLGADVTLIEKEKVGGTCLNWGCIPSKVLKTTAEMLHSLKRAEAFGVSLGDAPTLDYSSLSARKDRVVQDQVKGIHGILAHHGVRYLEGTAALRDQRSARVTLPDGDHVDVPWDKLILATGSRPLEIPALPFDGERVLSSNHAFELKEIPASLLIVGGGVIGCEFAMIFSAFGVKVTLVEALSRLLPLPSVDGACSKVLQREMKKQRIEFMVNRTVERVEEAAGRGRAIIGPSSFAEGLKEKDRKPLARDVDKVLVCVGRKANTDGIGLETLGVQMDERGWIVADETLRTSAPGVYAIGDVLGPVRPMLAHVASKEGLAAAENALGGETAMTYHAVPGAVFTFPEVADVGLTEAQARDQGLAVRAHSVLFRSIGKAHVIGEIAGEAKIVSEAETGRVLGVHIIGPHASDLIAEGTLAVQTGCTVQDLAETIHAHPTLSEIMLEVSLKAMDRSLHG